MKRMLFTVVLTAIVVTTCSATRRSSWPTNVNNSSWPGTENPAKFPEPKFPATSWPVEPVSSWPSF